jgi:RimJ/RimL family protein N-acetyltransferase
MEPFLLIGEHVALEPLLVEHVEELVAAATEDRATYDWTLVPADATGMVDYVEHLLAERDEGRTVPFVQRRLLDGQLVGCTRYMDIRSWSGRDTPDEVEVGGTWLAASAQRTPINTEAKLLMFGHAFEVWKVHRLALATDARNERSRAAIERVGGKLEGVLRHHRWSYAPGERGQPRDTAIFSIIPSEWPAVKAGLQARLA